MFKMEICTGNEATCRSEDLADLIRQVSMRIEDGSTSGSIIDYNGNKVGTYCITEE